MSTKQLHVSTIRGIRVHEDPKMHLLAFCLEVTIFQVRLAQAEAVVSS